jgi:hypothetical protein
VSSVLPFVLAALLRPLVLQVPLAPPLPVLVLYFIVVFIVNLRYKYRASCWPIARSHNNFIMRVNNGLPLLAAVAGYSLIPSVKAWGAAGKQLDQTRSP